MNPKYLLAGAIGGALIRRGMDELCARHPHIANGASIPAHWLYTGAEVMEGFDLARPDTWLRMAARIISPRPPSDADTPPPIPPGVTAALKRDGLIIGAQSPVWDLVLNASWHVMHDVYGLAAYSATRYGARHWLITRKAQTTRAGWLIEHDTSPLATRDGFIMGRWACPVVSSALDWRVYAGGPHDLTADELHELFWPSERGLGKFEVTDTAIGPSWSASFAPHAPATFFGPQLVHRARWTRKVRERAAYNVMIYGAPGCGKTTLIRQWFHEEGLRVAQVTARALMEFPSALYTLTTYKPDVVLIEDFDRIGALETGALLWFFEHGQSATPDHHPHAHRPMILATSNHPDQVADAFWRPGRFDQVIEISPPADDVPTDQLTRDMAARFGLTWERLDDATRERARHILHTLTVAHLEAYMQRLAEDPASLDGPGDRTFDPPVKTRKV